jgi:hypothetical protein
LHSSSWEEPTRLRVIHSDSLTCLKIGSVIKGMTSLPPWGICLQSRSRELLSIDLLHVWINIYFTLLLELIYNRLVFTEAIWRLLYLTSTEIAKEVST